MIVLLFLNIKQSGCTNFPLIEDDEIRTWVLLLHLFSIFLFPILTFYVLKEDSNYIQF